MRGLEFLILIALLGLALMAGVLLVRRSVHRTWQQELVAYVLRFPRGLDPAAVVAFLEGLSGIAGPRHERAFRMRAVVFETSATAVGIEHRLVLPRSLAHVALSALRAALPSVSARPDEDYHLQYPVLAAELGISDHGRTLATDRAGSVSNAILAALHPLAAGEQLVVQWSLAPLGPVALPSKVRGQPVAQHVWDLLRGQTTKPQPVDPEVVKAARLKQQTPLFAGAVRVGVTAERLRARSLLSRVLAAFHTANAPGVHLRRLTRSSGRVGGALAKHQLPLVNWPCTVNAAELAGLLAFPFGKVTLPGLQLGGTRQLAPAAGVPSVGRVVAEATFPGAERPLALSVPDSLRHLHVIGPTGTGKSTLLAGLIAQDMAAGRGVVVIDPKGDLVADVLDGVPAHRLDDVVVLDAADELRPVGLNLLAGGDSAPELVVDQIVGIFSNLFAASWGARSDDILRASLLTLVGVPGMSLAEVPLLLADPGFRRRLVGRVQDPILKQFWSWFEGISDGERGQATAPLSNKLRAVLLRRRLRNVVGQAEPKLDLDQALDDSKILLVPLAKGMLGEQAAALMGSLVVARMWQAVQRRSAIPQAERPLTFAFVDEFQDYLKLPLSVADVLAQARGLGLGLTLAHQHLGQLPSELQKAVLANARSRVIFQTAAGDAAILAKELAPHLEAQDLQGLGAYEVVATLSAGARIAPPVTARTLLPPPSSGLAAEARRRSREHYGQDRSEVEAAIQARHEGRPVAGDLGRREVRP